MTQKKRSPWFWVPTLYYAEGIPYIVVMMVSVIMYKRMGVSNTDIALYTSWLYLPWVIKPLWSPVVDILRTKRFWIIAMQLIIGAGLGGVALTLPLPGYFQLTLGFFWLLAFSSATHDIAADGFYMLGLSQHDQAWFVGVRSTFYRLAMITGQGLLIILAGFIESNSGLPNHELSLEVKPGVERQVVVHPDSLTIVPEPGELRIQTFPRDLAIPTGTVAIAEFDSVKSFVSQWNRGSGHLHAEETTGAVAASEQKEVSAWQRWVVLPLEDFLRSNFGTAVSASESNQTGNFAVLYLYLSTQPEAGETVVVNFSRIAGDQSIALIEGGRLEFNSENWNRPAMAMIQIDGKLKTESHAEFLAQSGNITLAWSVTFFILGALFIVFFIYHKFMLPFPSGDQPGRESQSTGVFSEFISTFVLFFRKEKIGVILSFLMLYRLAESQLVKLASPFLLDTQDFGGLALTTGEVGFVYGTVGLLSLTLGGLLGGFLAARHGLRYWLWPMAIAINLPDAVYVYLSYAHPDSFLIINLCVAIEQFGYGFGFTAYMLFMIYVSEGNHKTAHFAITTGFMALGMMLPGMFSGWLQDIIGYQNFFIWVLIATIPGFAILPFLPIDPEFGKKTDNE